MDKPHNAAAAGPGYETRDANVGSVFTFLIILAAILVVAGLVCWGMFHYFSANELNEAATESPFADARQLPLGPQLQVTPREDWLKFRAGQQKSLETYEWVNRSSGTVRVPIDVAMDLLVKKGVPVQAQNQAQAGGVEAPAPKATPAEGGKKP